MDFRSLSRRTIIRGVNRWTYRRISLKRIPRVLNRLPLDSYLDRVVVFHNTPIYRYFLLVLSRYSRKVKRIARIHEHALSPLLYFPEASPLLGRWLLHHYHSSPPRTRILRARKVPLVNLLFRLVIAIHRRQATVSHRSASNPTSPDTFQLARDSIRCNFTSPMFSPLSNEYLTTTFHIFLPFAEGITSFQNYTPWFVNTFFSFLSNQDCRKRSYLYDIITRLWTVRCD